MKEDLVTFETAELALSKGFYRETMGHKRTSVRYDYYNHLGELNGDCTEHIKELLRNKGTQERTADLIPAPTQSLLQKWLRDKYNISISIPTGITNGKHTYECWIMLPNGKEIEPMLTQQHDEKYGTIFYEWKYEDALEKGLQEALKIIQ